MVKKQWMWVGLIFVLIFTYNNFISTGKGNFIYDWFH